MPGFLSYSVAVFLKWQSGNTLPPGLGRQRVQLRQQHLRGQRQPVLRAHAAHPRLRRVPAHGAPAPVLRGGLRVLPDARGLPGAPHPLQVGGFDWAQGWEGRMRTARGRPPSPAPAGAHPGGGQLGLVLTLAPPARQTGGDNSHSAKGPGGQSQGVPGGVLVRFS
jgi:hypothetical protein